MAITTMLLNIYGELLWNSRRLVDMRLMPYIVWVAYNESSLVQSEVC